MLNALVNSIQPYSHILGWLGIVSAVSMVLGILLLPWLVGFIPVDFLTNHHEVIGRRRKAGWLACLLRNAIGFLLLLAGIIMLIIPGQGLLTMLVGLMLMDYPGKYALEVRLLSNPRVFASINWLRQKRGCDPLEKI